MRDPGGILGRDKLVGDLVAQALAGHTVLAYGPQGVGKSAILAAIHERIRSSGKPCALAPRTEHIRDATHALADVYVDTDHHQCQRALRGQLLLEVEARPGVLLLDDLRGAGTALRCFLRSLEGLGLGIILAADAENERDHARLRSMRVAYRELAVPRLPRRFMRLLLERDLAHLVLPASVTDQDRRSLLAIASGRPGTLRLLKALLPNRQYWHAGRLRTEALRGAATMATGRAYLTT